MRDKILNILAASKDYISGVEISSQLNVSRVAVWKHIKKLMEDGYTINSSKKGYLLETSRDLIDFKNNFESEVIFFPHLSSTMDYAKDLAKNETSDFSVVVAETQTMGRGRLNRSWASSKGGLWFTIVAKPKIPFVFAYKFNFAASVAIVETLKENFKINAKVKWPNDVYLHDKKIAGILSEMETTGGMISYINIGIGLNVNNISTPKNVSCISLKEVLGHEISREKILYDFLTKFQKLLREADVEHILDLWRKNTSTIGKNVQIETFNDVFTGKALDIDETGALILELNNNTHKKIIYGDCFYNN